jgi:hypothetical protein
VPNGDDTERKEEEEDGEEEEEDGAISPARKLWNLNGM